MMQSVTIEDLKKIIALSELSDEHLQWILAHSEYRELVDGDLIAKYGEPADWMWIILEGKIAFYMYINGRQVYFYTFENNNLTGGIGGVMPYSRMKTYPGYSYALGEVKLIGINRRDFPELEQLSTDFSQKLIAYMTERARIFATTQLQHEKVNALGNLAAGIAHEMNNPAAAIKGISNELTKRLNRNYELTKKLLDCNITPEHLQHIRSLVKEKDSAPADTVKWTTLQRMENEDEIEDWLAQNGIADRETAETFSEYGFSEKELERISTDLGKGPFIQLIPWLENLLSSQKIIIDLADASSRISNLVGSIKSHVHMDRANDLQLTNVHQDIENTLTLLGFKLRGKNIDVIKKFGQNIPEVPAYVSELNQVWTNLIDNAVFALEKNGVLTIETSQDIKNVIVSIIDNGVGIPEDIVSRIFDPFFTTKKVGEGTGIGLDLVKRIVKRHNGEIKLTTEPGRTSFSVYIPIVQISAQN